MTTPEDTPTPEAGDSAENTEAVDNESTHETTNDENGAANSENPKTAEHAPANHTPDDGKSSRKVNLILGTSIIAGVAAVAAITITSLQSIEGEPNSSAPLPAAQATQDPSEESIAVEEDPQAAGEIAQGDEAAEEAAAEEAPELVIQEALPLPLELPGGNITDIGAIAVGSDTPVTVIDIYQDYQCPYCQEFHTTYGADLADLATGSDEIQLRIHTMAFLGEAGPALQPAGNSARAANAAMCTAAFGTEEQTVDMDTILFNNTGTPEQESAYQTSDLVGYARDIGASDRVVECIETEELMQPVSYVTQSALGRGVPGTPLILVNGEVIQDSRNSAELNALLGR